MSERTTKKQVVAKFEQFVSALGGEIGHKNGQYYMEYNSIYGGYQITRICNDMGGESDIFGTMRRRASEMWYTMDFALKTLWINHGSMYEPNQPQPEATK